MTRPCRSIALAREDRATELPGVGAIIQEKVLALADDGMIPAAEKLRAKFPPGLLELTHLPGLGPKRARRLFEELGIHVAGGARRCRAGRADPGAEGIRSSRPRSRCWRPRSPRRRGPPRARTAGGRVVLHRALAVAEPLVAALRAHPASERVELAGSARRMADSVKDLDVIASAADPLALARAAASLDLVESAGTSPPPPACDCAPTPA